MSLRRVRRPAQHEDLVQRLVGDEGPFSTLAEVLTFAAAFGYANDRREVFTNTGQAIDFEVFDRLGASALVDMLAASVHDDVTILSDDGADDRLTIFEEYANGGLSVLSSRLQSSRGDLEQVLEFVLDRDGSRDGSADDGDFDSIVEELTS